MCSKRTSLKLFYRKAGSGRPLIILHGLFGQSDNWNSLAKQFAGQLQVFTADLRNHGLSPHSHEWTYPAMTADLLEVISENHLEEVILLGHSLGGKAAMHFALHHPALVSKLIVVDIAPKEYPAGQDKVIEALLSVRLGSIASRKEAEDQLAQFISDAPTRQFLLKNLYRPEGSEGFAWRFNLEAIARNRGSIGQTFDIEGRQYKRPTLFLSGEHADYIRKEDEPQIKKYFPDAVIQTVPGAGHWIHADKPKEFAEAVLAFISS